MADEKRKVQLEAGLDATGVKSGVESAKASLRELPAEAKKAGDEATKGFEKVGKGATGAAGETDRATSRMIAALQRSTAAIEAGGSGTAKYYENIAKLRGVNGDLLKPYIDSLRKAEEAQAAAANGLGKIGISAAQTQAALRNVPAQFTDIFTSLASGQAPMTVFLQQGGQLKDMFGGAGPAAKALGGYVLGLVNPFTVAGAAALGLAYAYNKGASEAQEFQKTLILSGNAAGVTAGQLMDMAAGVSAIGASTQGRAAEVLNQMAAAGGIGAANLQRFAASALELEKVGGPAAEKTADAFAELGKRPLEAVIKLNEAQHFLTEETYKTIKALSDQGRSVEAAKIAQEAYDDALKSRTPAMLERLGYIERAWLGIKDGVKGVADAMLDLGRGATTAEQYQTTVKLLEERRGRNQQLGIKEGKATRGLEAEVQALKWRMEFEQQLADADKYMADRAAGRIRADEVLSKNLGKAQRMKLEIDQTVAALRGFESQDVIDSEVAKIKAKYAERGGNPGNSFAAEQEAAKQWAKYYQEFGDAALEADGKVLGLTKTQSKLVEYLQSPAYQKMGEPARQLALEQAYAAIEAEKLAEVNKELVKLSEEAAKSQAKVALEYERSAQSVADQVQRMVDEDEAAKIAARGYMSLEQSIQSVAIARLREQQVAAMADPAAVAALQREIEKREKLIGLIGSRDTRAANQRAAEDAAREWERASEQMGQALTNALMEGGKSAAEYIKGLFRTMVLRPVIQAVVAPFAGVLGAGNAFAGGGASAGGSLLSSASGFGNLISGAGSFLNGSMLTSKATFAAGDIGEWLMNNTGGVFNKLGGSILANQQAIGAIAGGLGNAFAGYGLSKAISGGYKIGDKDYVSMVSAVASAFLGPIGGVVGGLVNRAFGRKLKDAGIEGTFGDEGFSGNSYQFLKGGVFRSNKTKRSALDAETDSVFDAGFKAVDAQTRAYVAALGLPATALEGFTKSIKLSLKGLSEEQMKEAIEKTFVDLGESMAERFKGALLPFQKAGETLSETLKRLGVLQGFSNTLADLGGVFGRVANLAVDAREQMIELAGGMEAFAASALSYVQNYYSREEIAGLKAREIQGVLSSVGITQDVSTKEQFRALVDGLDVNSESGRSQLAALLGLQGDFLQVADFNTETGRTLSGTAALAPQGGAAAQILANATDAQVVATNTVAQKQDTTNTLLEKIFGAVSNRGGLDAPWKPPAVDYSNVEVGGA